MPDPRAIGALAHMLGIPFEIVQGFSNQNNGRAPRDLQELIAWGSKPDWQYGIPRYVNGEWRPIGNGSTNWGRSEFDRKANPQWSTVNNLEDFMNMHSGDTDPKWHEIFAEYEERGGDAAFFGGGLKPSKKTQQAPPAAAPPAATPPANRPATPTNTSSGGGMYYPRFDITYGNPLATPTGAPAAGWGGDVYRPEPFRWGRPFDPSKPPRFDSPRGGGYVHTDPNSDIAWGDQQHLPNHRFSIDPRYLRDYSNDPNPVDWAQPYSNSAQATYSTPFRELFGLGGGGGNYSGGFESKNAPKAGRYDPNVQEPDKSTMTPTNNGADFKDQMAALSGQMQPPADKRKPKNEKEKPTIGSDMWSGWLRQLYGQLNPVM